MLGEFFVGNRVVSFRYRYEVEGCPLAAHAPPGDIMMWASCWSRSPYVFPVELFMYSLKRWVMSPCVKRVAYIVWDGEKTR